MYNYTVMSDITLPIDPCPAATGAGLFFIIDSHFYLKRIELVYSFQESQFYSNVETFHIVLLENIAH